MTGQPDSYTTYTVPLGDVCFIITTPSTAYIDLYNDNSNIFLSEYFDYGRLSVVLPVGQDPEELVTGYSYYNKRVRKATIEAASGLQQARAIYTVVESGLKRVSI
jgi:hypothetical protein